MALFFAVDCYHLFGFALGVIATVALLWSRLSKVVFTGNNSDKLSNQNVDYSKCSSLECVRCSQKNSVIPEAINRLGLYQCNNFKISERVRKALFDHEDILIQQKGLMQQPRIFFIPGLRTSPFWNNKDFVADAKILKEGFHDINKEFCRIYGGKGHKNWATNIVPTGRWHMFHLINQGSIVKVNAKSCPKTMALIKRMQSVVTKNLFGNVSFSVVVPGTHITPHYGPCNYRIRAHLALLAPRSCTLTVGGISHEWKVKDTMFFDDSFLHEVHHAGSEIDGPRAVLILDLWHPDISPSERHLLDYTFSGETENNAAATKHIEHPFSKKAL